MMGWFHYTVILMQVSLTTLTFARLKIMNKELGMTVKKNTKKKKGEYRMDIVSCPYWRYMTDLGCPELTKIFCDNDERVYGNLPGLKFERTGTLGKGAKRCDFYLRKVQTKD